MHVLVSAFVRRPALLESKGVHGFHVESTRVRESCFRVITIKNIALRQLNDIFMSYVHNWMACTNSHISHKLHHVNLVSRA